MSKTINAIITSKYARIIVALPIAIGVLHPSITPITVLFYTSISLPYWFSIFKKIIDIYSSYIILFFKLATLGFYIYRFGSVGIFNRTLVVVIASIFSPPQVVGIQFRHVAFLSWIVFQEYKNLNIVNQNL